MRPQRGAQERRVTDSGFQTKKPFAPSGAAIYAQRAAFAPSGGQRCAQRATNIMCQRGYAPLWGRKENNVPFTARALWAYIARDRDAIYYVPLLSYPEGAQSGPKGRKAAQNSEGFQTYKVPQRGGQYIAARRPFGFRPFGGRFAIYARLLCPSLSKTARALWPLWAPPG